MAHFRHDDTMASWINKYDKNMLQHPKEKTQIHYEIALHISEMIPDSSVSQLLPSHS